MRFGLANKGVDYAIDQYNDKLIPAALRAEVDELKARDHRGQDRRSRLLQDEAVSAAAWLRRRAPRPEQALRRAHGQRRHRARASRAGTHPRDHRRERRRQVDRDEDALRDDRARTLARSSSTASRAHWRFAVATRSRPGSGWCTSTSCSPGPYTALENVLLGAATAGARSCGRSCRRASAAREKLEELCAQYGLAVDWDAPGRAASGRRPAADRDPQAALSRRADPDPRRADRGADSAGNRRAFRQLPQAHEREGKTIIIITHKLTRCCALAAEVTVFRAGRTVAEVAAAETSEQELADLMVGPHGDL